MIARLTGFRGSDRLRVGGIAAVKMLLGATVASHFLYGLFVPFLNLAVGGFAADPWQAAIDHGISNAFPYGPVMFYLMLVPRLLVAWAVPADPALVTWIHLLAARLPLLGADLAILALLIHGLKTEAERTLLLWWMSPIVLYVTYVHGQLDLIPTALLLASLALLFRGRYAWAAVVLGLGLSTKSHLFVALPFLAIFTVRKEMSWLRGAQFAAVTVGAYGASLFPWVLSPGFRAMVFGTEEQQRVFRVAVDYLPALHVYLAPLAIGVLFLQFASYKKVNRDMLLMFLGLAYTVLVTLIPPAHGYYIWPLPFIVYFFSQQTLYPRLLLWAFNVSCLAYLMLGHDSTFFESLGMLAPAVAGLRPLTIAEGYGIDGRLANSLLYTAVQASVLTIAFMMYRYGVQVNIIYRPRTRPVLVGVGGDSGSGKHTARDTLAAVLGPDNVLTVDGDDVHRWERGHEMWKVVSHLDPSANDLYLLFEHAEALGRGQTITRVRYDHATGKFTQPARVSPGRFVFVIGLHPFYMKRMREMLDIRIYMDTEEELRQEWKMHRDVRDRGYSAGQVLEQLRTRETDAAAFVRPQQQFADMVVQYYRRTVAVPAATTGSPALGIRLRVDNSLPFTRLAEELKRLEGTRVSVVHEEDLVHQTLVVEGDLSVADVRAVADRVLPQLNELVVARPGWHGGHNGVLQLCFLILLSDVLGDAGRSVA
ncbi:MAG: hypothetical protein HY727_01330 [Candidatus Rokubacteria bacterium]|nr:hypothetical protein [Candidatus Rokubacteria bacterium]